MLLILIILYVYIKMIA